MVRLIQAVQIVSAALLAGTLVALGAGILAQTPATITLGLSLLAQVAGLISSSPLTKKTTIEEKVIEHLKGLKGTEPKSDFMTFLDGAVRGERVDQIYAGLVS